ncbi:MAG: crossover junction endodeoxyribonuclease RuvC [Candidatus Aminicenantes bacterium]|nr:crossover junction endodeoxyribonuclease RuvC [Candidatus Aminicenantes bacterium]
MRILGVDPGLKKTGYALLDNMKLLKWGIITSNSDWKSSIVEITDALEKKIADLNPQHIAIESPFSGINPSSSFKLAHLRGAIIYMAKKQGIEVYDYSPAKVKKVITGRGNASKNEVRNFIGKIFKQISGFDEADAIAIAFTHFLEKQHDRKIKG